MTGAAKEHGAEVIDYNAEDPVEALKRLTGGIGPDRAFDPVGGDANQPNRGSPHGCRQPRNPATPRR